MYKEIIRSKARFNTVKGLLTVEELWDLSVADLNTLVVSLEEQYNASKGKTYLRVKSKKDKSLKLMFDVALDVLNTKLDEQEVARNASDVKAEEQKLLSLLAKKREAALEELSEEEIKAKLKDLKK